MKHYLSLLLLMLAAPVAAQSYPVKPIEMISPTGAGGGSDLVARTVAEITRFLTEMGLVVKKDEKK